MGRSMYLPETHTIFFHGFKGSYLSTTFFTNKETRLGSALVEVPRRVDKITAAFFTSEGHIFNPEYSRRGYPDLISLQTNTTITHIVNDPYKARIKSKKPLNITRRIIQYITATRTPYFSYIYKVAEFVRTEKKLLHAFPTNKLSFFWKKFLIFKHNLILTNKSGGCNVK